MKVDFHQIKDSEEIRVIVQASDRTQEVEDLMEAIRSLSPSPLDGYSEGTLTKLRKDALIRIYSKDKRVYADTLDGSFLIKCPLYQLEEQLPPNFVRISNSEIVNVDRILRLDMNLAGTIRIYLEGDIESHVSRRYLSKVKGVLM